MATSKRNFSKFLPYKSLIVISLATIWRLSSKLSENIEIMGLSNVYGRLYARYYKGSCEESISWIEQAKKDNLEGFCFIILSQFQRKIKGTAQWRMTSISLVDIFIDFCSVEWRFLKFWDLSDLFWFYGSIVSVGKSAKLDCIKFMNYGSLSKFQTAVSQRFHTQFKLNRLHLKVWS